MVCIIKVLFLIQNIESLKQIANLKGVIMQLCEL